MTIHNPILPGFNPDPSIARVGDDYYIATSTFEWFPGVQIHHSRDLVHWRLLTRPLNRPSQLNMLGDPDSCGIWAPCLSYADGLFWLIFTDVKRYGRATVGGASGASPRDFHNYLVTCPRIEGDWSDPVYLNSSGFDPSLIHDDDGRKYLVNMLWDPRPGNNRFAGIVLQEYSVNERKLAGKRINIFKGTPLGFTEAPHLYKRNGWYYLLTAEGGTGWGHAVTMARSRELAGPYELHPDTYILSARHRPDAELQRAGHGSLVETPNGETYIAYLCGRPLKHPLHPCPSTRSRQRRRAKISTARSSPLISNGCALRGPGRYSASPPVPASFAFLAATPSAACSLRGLSPAASNRIASAPRRWSSSSRNIFNRARAWSVTTTARSFITSASRMMKPSENISV